MKGRVYNAIGIILIVIGIGIMGATIYMKYDTYQKQNKLRKSFEQSMNNLVDDSTSSDPKKELSPNEKPTGQQVEAIALLIIPKMDLNVAVAEGVDMDILNYAIGHFPETAKPGQKGNFSLAGHRNFTHAEFFKNLDKLEKDDDIIVKTKDKKEYTYKVTEKFIVDPSKVEILDPTKDATITLVTCTTGATQRLVVKGILEK